MPKLDKSQLVLIALALAFMSLVIWSKFFLNEFATEYVLFAIWIWIFTYTFEVSILTIIAGIPVAVLAYKKKTKVFYCKDKHEVKTSFNYQKVWTEGDFTYFRKREGTVIWILKVESFKLMKIGNTYVFMGIAIVRFSDDENMITVQGEDLTMDKMTIDQMTIEMKDKQIAKIYTELETAYAGHNYLTRLQGGNNSATRDQ